MVSYSGNRNTLAIPKSGKLQQAARQLCYCTAGLLMMFQLVACGIYNQPPPTNQVYFNQKIFADRNASPGWVAYGIALSSWEPSYLANGKLNYFDREVFARSEAATVWKKLREDGSVDADKDLDALWVINDSGFMKEYLWVYLKRDSFQNPGNLRLEEFRQWAAQILQQHQPVENPGVSF